MKNNATTEATSATRIVSVLRRPLAAFEVIKYLFACFAYNNLTIRQVDSSRSKSVAINWLNILGSFLSR
jgi:hypothetical protein